jgi:hypothetical protein
LTSPQHFHLPGHSKRPLHLLPHFRLGRFGNGIDFDLYLFLPNLREDRSSVYLTLEEEKAWVERVLLPAAMAKIPGVLLGQWSSDWQAERNKMHALKEGKKLDPRKDEVKASKLMEIENSIAPEYLGPFWNEVKRLLDNGIASDGPLRGFMGYKLLCTGKNWKTRVFETTSDLRKLKRKMDVVKSEKDFADDRCLTATFEWKI